MEVNLHPSLQILKMTRKRDYRKAVYTGTACKHMARVVFGMGPAKCEYSLPTTERTNHAYVDFVFPVLIDQFLTLQSSFDL